MSGSPRVAVIAPGDPESPGTWSGVTSGILGGLRALGVATWAIDLALPRGVEQALLACAAVPTRNRYDAEGARLTMRVRSALAQRRLRAISADGVIQIGTTFALPPGTSYVTLEDMTLRQAVEGHPVFSRMSARTIARWERRRVEIYARAKVCTAASQWTGESLRADYDIPPARVAVVGFGSNHSAVPRERDWGTPRFLFVGIDWERKGGPQLLRAFAGLRRVIPAATLDVVGGHPSLSEPGVETHGVLSPSDERDRATLAGLFARATCFVMPSRIEPFGIAYVEAGCVGVPSIASSVGGPRDVIGLDGGIVVGPDDQEGLLAAMMRLADPATAQRMGEVARQRSTFFTWPKVAERLLRALDLRVPDGRELAEYL